MDVTERFTSRVSDYVKSRPGYPTDVIEVLHREINFGTGWKVADVGSGTGISARLFLEAGNEVWGIEPNNAMREASEKSLDQFDSFHSVDGRSEATTLPDSSTDLIVAAQAFHWFDRDAFRRECLRIASPRGHLLLMWNDRKTTGSPFLEGYEKLLNDFGLDYREVNHRRITDEVIDAFFAPSMVKKFSLVNQQLLDESGFMSRLMSSSYVPQENHPTHRPLIDRAKEIFDLTNVDGFVTIAYELKMYLGKIGSN